jgi:hypothetical protein
MKVLKVGTRWRSNPTRTNINPTRTNINPTRTRDIQKVWQQLKLGKRQ